MAVVDAGAGSGSPSGELVELYRFGVCLANHLAGVDRVFDLKVNGTAAPVLGVVADGCGYSRSLLVELHPDREALLGVSISKREKCTLSRGIGP